MADYHFSPWTCREAVPAGIRQRGHAQDGLAWALTPSAMARLSAVQRARGGKGVGGRGTHEMDR